MLDARGAQITQIEFPFDSLDEEGYVTASDEPLQDAVSKFLGEIRRRRGRRGAGDGGSGGGGDKPGGKPGGEKPGGDKPDESPSRTPSPSGRPSRSRRRR